jgi:hypothetical protein
MIIIIYVFTILISDIVFISLAWYNLHEIEVFDGTEC